MDDYEPQQVSTFALTLFRHATKVGEEDVIVGESTTSCCLYMLFLGEAQACQSNNIYIYAGCGPLTLNPILTATATTGRFCSVHPRSDFWDTAGQERFNDMHPSYYHQAHACLLVSDASGVLLVLVHAPKRKLRRRPLQSRRGWATV